MENLTRGLLLAGHVEVPQTSAARRRGLLGVDNLPPDFGLWITPCEAVHTFGMKIALDAVFIDRRCQVRKLATNLAPRRMAFCWSAQSVLELRAGTVSRTGTQCGDQLKFNRLAKEELAPNR